MKYISTFILALLVSCGAMAQTVDTTKQDSINKAQQQIQNDSLNAAKKNASPNSKNSKDTRPFLKRWSIDVYTSFWVNPSNTYFEFSPVLTYHFPKIFAIGAGPAYVLNRSRTQDINLSGWGAKVFGRANVTKWLYGYTEYQGINNQYVTGIDLDSHEISQSNQLVNSWFLSVGINIRFGRRHGINMQALYDVLYNKETSPYYGAWIYRVGFGF